MGQMPWPAACSSQRLAGTLDCAYVLLHACLATWYSTEYSSILRLYSISYVRMYCTVLNCGLFSRLFPLLVYAYLRCMHGATRFFASEFDETRRNDECAGEVTPHACARQ